MNRILVATLIIVACTSCSIGPDYERPFVPDPETFRTQPQEDVDTASLAEMPWWELFQDEELHYLIRVALQENKDLLIAAARVAEAKGELGVTRSALFPQLGAEARYSYRGIPSALIPGEPGDIILETDIYSIGGSLSWEIDVWGQLRRATEASRAELLASEEARRAIIRQAEQNLVAANAEIGVALGNFLPRFSLTGDLGVISRDLNQLFTGPARIWGIGPGVTVPIFTAGRNLGNLEATEARQRQEVLRYEQTILQAFQEVEDSLIAYKKARVARVQYEKLVLFNSRAVDLSQIQYEEGLIDYLNVLDAQRRLFESEIDLARTQRFQLVSLVQLYKALGGGWTPDLPMAQNPEQVTEETLDGSPL
jgi:outer membrane protein TolC